MAEHDGCGGAQTSLASGGYELWGGLSPGTFTITFSPPIDPCTRGSPGHHPTATTIGARALAGRIVIVGIGCF